MADENYDDGLLNQDDINAALEAGGLGDHSVQNSAPEESSDAGELSQEEIDRALAGGGDAAEDAAGSTRDAGDEQAQAGAAPQSGQKAEDARVDASGRPFDEIAAAMADAIEAESASNAGDSSGQTSGSQPPGAASAAPMEIPALDAHADAEGDAQSIDLLRDVNLDVKIELGRSRMYVEDVLRLNEGSVVELDKLAGDPVDVLVNGRLVARGEVLVLNDTFCVRINDIVSKLPSEEEANV